MIDIKKRIREEITYYGKKKKINYIYFCDGCKTEIKRTKYEELFRNCYCIKCAGKFKINRSIYINNLKKCSKCKNYKPLNNFHKKSNKIDNLDSQCKLCKKEYSKNYYKNNKERSNTNLKIWYHNNKNNSVKKHIRTVRSLIYQSFQNKGFIKNSKTENLLGCSFLEFKNYIESKWEKWMSWDNHGKFNGKLNYGWDIDHIIPISSASSINEINILCHYTNFQPLCSYINRYIKKNKY